MNADEDRGWRAIIGSSSIMSLALLGDALLYAVLPAYATDFGLTLPWVGVMLSANRFVRVFAYGVIARLASGLGLRKMCLWAAVTATVSTAAYGLVKGPELMLVARILWGLTYASLVLTTLSYAVAFRDKVGTRVGVGQGPLLLTGKLSLEIEDLELLARMTASLSRPMSRVVHRGILCSFSYRSALQMCRHGVRASLRGRRVAAS